MAPKQQLTGKQECTGLQCPT